MLTYSRAFYQLKEQLQSIYDADEATAIGHLFLEFITGQGKLDRLINKDVLLTESQQDLFDSRSKDLISGKPLQYVTNSAWFQGRKFFVNEQVLIPRPETEELVLWIVDDVIARFPEMDDTSPLSILDIGTGSGCIPVSLALGLPFSTVSACDISQGALKVAGRNAATLNATVNFIQLDFLDSTQHNKLAHYDVIVSNPPYIPAEGKKRLHSNVKDYEPSLALFVPDDDALVFYKAIAAFGQEHLNSNGYIYCELDAAHASDCKLLFEETGYKNVEIRKDMHGNWRMLRAEKGSK